MHRELEELHQRLLDPDSRGRGSACVLLWCLSGGGKSHLARQYVYTHREDYPGGIFWVRARSGEEIAQDYWEIAQKVALKDVQDPRTASYEQHTEAFIKAVRTWFEEREGWLLVLDGITISHEDDKSALQAFIPDSKNSSVILTTVNRSLAGSHRLLNPVPVKVMRLADAEARELVFRELGIGEPKPEEIEKATEIVRKVHGLPLAIHAICYRIRYTHEPLLRYHVKPYAPEAKLREPFVEIMDDLDRLGHREARNLINLLCFFGRHVPFEMVHLGVPALLREGVDVRAREGGGRPDLNNTIAVLIRYALVERNDPDDAKSHSSRSNLVESIDVLRMHTVVQYFLGDELRTAGILPLWLTHAVHLFCDSFAAAYERIKRHETGGLVGDYRHYEVHGKRLLDHVKRNHGGNQVHDHVETRLQLTLGTIEAEIRRRTPGSSHETASGQVGHISVFDRTSSTSDAGPETPVLISPPTASIWPWEPSKPQYESPVDTTHPEGMPALPRLSPFPPYLPDDDGYQSDTDQPGQLVPVPVEQLPSSQPSPRQTPPVDVLPPVQEQQATSGDPPPHRTVSMRKTRRLHRYSVAFPSRDRNAPTSGAPAQLDLRTVGRVHTSPAPNTSRPARLDTSEALISLAALRGMSPTSSQTNAATTNRAPLHRATQSDTQALISSRAQASADVVTGRAQYPPSPAWLDSLVPGSAGGAGRPQGPAAMVRDGSRGSSRSREGLDADTRMGTSMAPSVLLPTTGSAPISVHSARPPSSSQNFAISQHSSPGVPFGFHLPSASNPELHTTIDAHSDTEGRPPSRYGRPGTARGGHDPASMGRLASSSRTRPPLESMLHGASNHAHRNPSQSMSSSMFTLPPSTDYMLGSYGPGMRSGLGGVAMPGAVPMGYASEPMSRDGSAQSVVAGGAPSVTGTEPSRFPPQFSPYAGSSSVLPQARVRPPTSSLRSTPLLPTQVTTSDATPRYMPDPDLAALGGWAPSPPAAATTTVVDVGVGPRAAGGPGIAASGTLTRPGDPDVFSLSRTSTNTSGHSFHQPSSPPYPTVSHMPRTDSDHQREVVRRPVEEQQTLGRGLHMNTPGQRRGLTHPPERMEDGRGVGLGMQNVPGVTAGSRGWPSAGVRDGHLRVTSEPPING